MVVPSTCVKIKVALDSSLDDTPFYVAMKARENQSTAAYPRRHKRHPTARSMAKWRFHSESGANTARYKKDPQRRIDIATKQPPRLRNQSPSARNDGKYLPIPVIPPKDKANSTDPRRTQTDEAAGHHQNPTYTMEESQRNLGRLLSHFTLPSPHVEGKMVACANPAVFVISRSPKLPSTADGQSRRSAEKEERGNVTNVQGGRGRLSRELQVARQFYVITSLLVFFPVVPIYNICKLCVILLGLG